MDRAVSRGQWVLLTCFVLVAVVAERPAAAQPVGPNDFWISQTGVNGAGLHAAKDPAVAYQPLSDELLVVWSDNEDPLTVAPREIYGQRVSASGVRLGPSFQISETGPPGDGAFNAFYPAVAAHPVRGEYLVVWSADGDAGGMTAGEFEIFGRRLAADATPLGPPFRISDMGGTGVPDYDAFSPDVVYNAARDEYLVVWDGDDVVGGLVDGEYEIFAQRLDADGAEVGANDFRVSAMGPTGSPTAEARDPAVAHNSVHDLYLVVWSGDPAAGGLTAGEHEIFGQLLTGDGLEIGSDDRRYTDMGGIGVFPYQAVLPAIAFNPVDEEFLVAWMADDDAPGQAELEYEIYAQRVDGVSGNEVGVNDFRVSEAGPDGDPSYFAGAPRVAFEPVSRAYTVAWFGDGSIGGLVDDEFEAQFRQLSSTGEFLHDRDQRISDLGGNGDPSFDVTGIALTVSDRRREVMAAFAGNDDVPPVFPGQQEIFGQRLRGRPPLFADGFGTGDTSRWSSASP